MTRHGVQQKVTELKAEHQSRSQDASVQLEAASSAVQAHSNALQQLTGMLGAAQTQLTCQVAKSNNSLAEKSGVLFLPEIGLVAV
jgi:hypothetical protein